MKKLFFLAVIAMASSMSSCKKNWTCTCSSTVNGVTVSASTTVNGTKSDATTACNAGTSSVTGVTCSIQ